MTRESNRLPTSLSDWQATARKKAVEVGRRPPAAVAGGLRTVVAGSRPDDGGGLGVACRTTVAGSRPDFDGG